jgi:DNA-binding FrmR family transcriptional regulator
MSDQDHEHSHPESHAHGHGHVHPDIHPHVHHSHAAIIKRLKRADGHLRSIITMIEEGRECVDIAQQLHAVEKAVCQAKRTLIQDHIDHCLEDTVASLGNGERAPLEAFKQITKYL